jgi:hypothetical protein
MEWETLRRIVRWYIFCLILTTIFYAALSQWQFGLHYAIDTMTLRGRIPDPDATQIQSGLLRWIFFLVEDAASLAVFVLLGFGISWLGNFLEEQKALTDFNVESHKGELKDFDAWLKERDPKLYAAIKTPQIPDIPPLTFREWLRRKHR